RLDITNLRTLCRSCHVTKTIRTRKRRTKNYSSNENLWL
ncbi:HNH endonuclease, partial [Vibrio diabolicus]